MALLVLGATGGTGSKVVALALAEGHEVVALVRNPAKLPSHERLTALQGSLTDPHAIDNAMSCKKKIAAVINVAGRRPYDKDPSPLMPVVLERVLEAMRKHGVKRYVHQLGAATRVEGHADAPWMSIIKPILTWLPLGADLALAENDKVATMIKDITDVDWICTRPAFIRDGEPGMVLRGVDPPTLATITFEALARWSLDAAFDPESPTDDGRNLCGP
ncbi:hypothetical protein CTAYLR_000030 [Chrysophaeum taylorii]|uniref:NAD(P)-binding domain-containing protein n=1 Tax=Chrysophaeum taylorii TaxID=2483200 RepID=A0AAD7UHA0_9STRA|nr:hypothetical protein CTAYLR_000030 [Chrysophaeum taylorii]